jgi:hypothetical protein
MVAGVSDTTITYDTANAVDLTSYFPTVTTIGDTLTTELSLLTDFKYIVPDNFQINYVTEYEVGNFGEYFSTFFSLFQINDKKGILLDICPAYITIGSVDNNAVSTYISFITSLPIASYNNIITQYKIPDTYLLSSYDFTIEYILYIKPLKQSLDTQVAFILSGTTLYSLDNDIFCAMESIYSYIAYDISVSPGRLHGLKTDIVNSNLKYDFIEFSAFASDMANKYVMLDAKTHNGAIFNYKNDIIVASELTHKGPTCDIRLLSLKITNNTLDQLGFIYFGDNLCVDIVDELFEIDTINSFFKVNGIVLTCFFADIANGTHMCYTVDSTFVANGPSLLEIVAANSAGDILIKSYEFLYGYSAELKDEYGFGFEQKISVHSCVSNMVTCDNTVCAAYTFSTLDMPSCNLNATISCVTYTDVYAHIVPQSTAFIPGYSYTVTISGIKDFSNNYLPPVHFSFTLEN